MTDTDFIEALFHTHYDYQNNDLGIELLAAIVPAFDFEKCGEGYCYKHTAIETEGHLVTRIHGNDFICRSNGLETQYGYVIINFLIAGKVTGIINKEKVCFEGSDINTQNFLWTGDCDVELKYDNATLVSLFYNYTPNTSKIDAGKVTNQLMELIKNYFINREALVRLAAQEFGNEIVLDLLAAPLGQKISMLKSFSYAALHDTAANNGLLKNYAHKSKVSVSTASRALFHGKSVTELLKKVRISKD